MSFHTDADERQKNWLREYDELKAWATDKVAKDLLEMSLDNATTKRQLFHKRFLKAQQQFDQAVFEKIGVRCGSWGAFVTLSDIKNVTPTTVANFNLTIDNIVSAEKSKNPDTYLGPMESYRVQCKTWLAEVLAINIELARRERM